MEIFEKITKKASEAYKITADKTGKIAKETKLKLRMGEIKTKTNEIYQEIGKKVYEKHVREEEISIKDELEEECTKLDVLSDEMENLVKQCLELKDKKKCAGCFKEIEKDMNFCPNCGEKQPKEEEEPKEVEVVEEDQNSGFSTDEDEINNEKNDIDEEEQNDVQTNNEEKNEDSESKFVNEENSNLDD